MNAGVRFGVVFALSVAANIALAEEDDGAARVQGLLAEFHQDYAFPGATVAFILPDGAVQDAAVGLADVEAGLAMTPQSRMLAASIGKTIVGALVLSLESDGVLARSDYVSQYLGDRPWFDRLPNASTMTIEHLLNQTSGLPDHVYVEGVVADMIAAGVEEDFKPEDAIAYVLDAAPLFEAGDAWAYTDTGYLLLGLVIEAATGADFYGLVSERFITPLDLAHTGPSNSPALRGLAVGYTTQNNAFGLPARTAGADGALLWNPAIEWTGGGFVSNSHDLARWGHAFFTGSAMDAPYLYRLLDAVPIHPDAPDILYGSGVGIFSDTEFGPVYGHGGWVPGYVSSLRHYADHGITVAFQINTDVGIVDDSTDLVTALEAAVARILIEAVGG